MKKGNSQNFGMNRTGIDASPIDSKKLLADVEELTMSLPGTSNALGQNRIREIREAHPIGHVPMPTTLRGALTGIRENFVFGTHALIDKLGERIAFERAGTRLYDALLVKHQASEREPNLPSYQEVKQIRDEECEHFRMLSETMREFGGDPTAITPAANIAAVMSMGLPQVLTDPRTSFLQCLDAILVAELTDNDCWDHLIELVEEAGLKETGERFRQAREHEDRHLGAVRRWIREMTLGKRESWVPTAAGIVPPSVDFEAESGQSRSV
jgi:rubrerythrin